MSPTRKARLVMLFIPPPSCKAGVSLTVPYRTILSPGFKETRLLLLWLCYNHKIIKAHLHTRLIEGSGEERDLPGASQGGLLIDDGG